MFFNKFISMNETVRPAKTISERTATLQQTNDWIAYRLIFNEPTIVSGFAMQMSAVPGTGLSINLKAGISTSLGPNGLFPYVQSNAFMNSNVGTAKTIGFVAETPTFVFDENTNFGLGAEFIYRVNLSSDYTLDAYTPYWIGLRCESATGTATFYDMCCNAVTDSSFATQHMNTRFQRLASATATTTGTDLVVTIPYYNAGTGKTIYHTKYPAMIESIQRQYNLNTSGREFGIKFEFNDLQIQDWEVQSILFDYLDTNAIDTQYCMRIYDGDNFDNVVGTGITLTPYDVQNTLFGNPASFEFVFSPPLKLRTNKTYFAGIAWTHPTTQPTSGALTITNYNMLDIQSNQSSIFAYRNTIGSGALTEVNTMKMPLNFYIKNTTPVSRAIGN